MEVNEKGNLNRLSLKGMSGSAGWKLALLMSLAFSMCVCHLCSQVMRVFGAVQNTGMLWVGGLEGKEGGLASLRPQERRGVIRGIFGIFQEPFQSGSRCILLPPRDPVRQT